MGQLYTEVCDEAVRPYSLELPSSSALISVERQHTEACAHSHLKALALRYASACGGKSLRAYFKIASTAGSASSTFTRHNVWDKEGQREVWNTMYHRMQGTCVGKIDVAENSWAGKIAAAGLPLTTNKDNVSVPHPHAHGTASGKWDLDFRMKGGKGAPRLSTPRQTLTLGMPRSMLTKTAT
eukprot:364501-Chlamydomonas_euryale.AAC.1